MADLKPLGSERLTGQDKLSRIMEIARFKENTPNTINETSKPEYSVSLADGNDYQIVRERQGYIIKKMISESEVDYIEPMKNRKYYSSYSQALKRLNLVAGELNRLNENEEGVSLYGEQKKFTLKTPKPAQEEMPAPVAEVPAAPPAVPSPELPPSPEGEEMDMGIEGEEMGPEGEEMDFDMDVETEKSEEDTDEVTFKTIQKLTGKLTQKIRVLDSQEGMTSEDIKYVINMVLSSLDLKSISEEDKEDIISKFEEDSEDLGGDDMDGEDMTDDTEVEDIQSDMDVEMEGEMEEGDMYGSFDDNEIYDYKNRMVKGGDMGDDDFDIEEFDSFQKLYDKHGDKQPFFNNRDGETMFNKYKEVTGRPFKVKTRKTEMEEELTSKDAKTMMKDIFGEESDIESEPKKRKIKHHSMTDEESAKVEEMIEGMFTESKVDNILKKYFRIDEKEKRLLEEKREKQVISDKETSKVNNRIKNLSESISQEISSKKLYKKYPNAKFLGKSTNQNLVFEVGNKKLRVTTNGNVK